MISTFTEHFDPCQQDYLRKVMPLVSKETKGRADGKRVNEIVREMTA
ncbi:MAG TPA: hypothetical protein VF040_11570 [Ktedonobacterales bacterium]